MPNQEEKEYFAFIVNMACELFCIDQVKKVIEVTYSGLFVDEYQDCSKKQHEMIMALANILPTHIVGDPMQGIFDFNGDIIDLDSDIKGFERSQLETPHRWYINESNALGDALKSMRDLLEKEQIIDLNNYSNVNGLHIMLIDQHGQKKKDITDVHSLYRRGIYKLLHNPDDNPDFTSLLLLVPNIHSKSNINARKQLRAQIDYTKSLTLIEAIDQEDLYKIATNIDEIINSPESYVQIKNGILSILFNLGNINNWFNDTGLKNKTNSDEKVVSEKLGEALDNFLANPSPFSMIILLNKLKNEFKFKYGREELWNGIIKALENASQEGITVYEGMKRHRNVVRRTGRKVTGKCLGTTLLTKGLEFDTVAILDAHEFDCRKHLYVALTRCCKNLIIFTKNVVLSPYKE
jgi:DNA helicase-2/ATP-dependent DNA helicase PcrA